MLKGFTKQERCDLEAKGLHIVRTDRGTGQMNSMWEVLRVTVINRNSVTSYAEYSL